MNDTNLSLETVINRRKELIRNKLWDCLTTDNLEAWATQFQTDSDERIATIALDALIVRTKSSAKAAMWHFLCSVVPEIINDSSCWNEFGVIPYDLLREFKFNLRILRLERSESSFGSGQSSDDLIRLLREEFCVHENYFLEPDPESHIILLDEISGSGNQAVDAIQTWQDHLNSNYRDMSVYFLALHRRGYKAITTKKAEIRLFFSEILGDETSLAKLIIENELANDISEAHEIITDFTERNFIKDEWKRLGYKEMAICYKPAFTACNNMAGLYLSRTRDTNVRLFERGLG